MHASQSPQRTDQRPKAGSWTILAIASLGAFAAFLDVTVVNIAFPSIRADFPGASLADLSWILNAYNVVFAALLLPVGRLADRFGPRRIFVAGLLVFSAASLLCGLAPSVVALVVVRVVQAVGAALVIPASLALILPAFPHSKRASAVGVFGAVAAVSAAMGPSLGGVLTELGDWRLVFWVNVPLGALAAGLARAKLSESRDQRQDAAPDGLGAALIAGCMGLLALGIVQGNEWGWGDARVLGAFAGAAVLALLFALRSKHHPAPIVERDLLAAPSFSAANAASLVFAAAFYAMLLCNVLFLTQVWGYSTLTAGLAVTPGPLIAALVAGPAGQVADRHGHRLVTVSGVLLFAAGIGLFVLRVGADAQYVREWLPATALTGMGIGLAFPALVSASVSAISPARFGTGSAVNSAARQLGAVLGIAILVAILGTPSAGEALSAFDSGWVFIAITALVSVPACLLLAPPAVAREQRG